MWRTDRWRAKQVFEGECLAETRKTRWADRLSAILLPAMQQRIEQDGANGSGAYNFYVQRVAQGKVFLEYEIALTEKLLSCCLDITHIHEVGCGFGQLVFLLGWNGFQAVGFDSDPNRARTAQWLQTVLNNVDADLTRNVTILSQMFPPHRPRLPEAGAMVVATNLVFSATAAERRALIRGMRRYRFVVIDAQRFVDLRTEPDGEQETLAHFAEAGFAPPPPFLDLGQGGKFYLFEGPVPPTYGWLGSLGRPAVHLRALRNPSLGICINPSNGAPSSRMR
jgi:hypothetical protein